MQDSKDGQRLGPRITLQGVIGGDVIDVNRHMNVSGFDKLFDQAESALFLTFGMGESWIGETQTSLFRLEKMVRYEHEMLEGRRFQTRSWVIGTDGKRIHHFHELWDIDNDRRSAIYDCLAIHVSLTQRKAIVFQDPALLGAIEGLRQAQALYGLPPGPLPRGLRLAKA